MMMNIRINRQWVMVGIAGVFIGMALILGIIAFDHATSTEAFCTSCHSMDYPAKEYRQSVHYRSRSGVRAVCGDCHVSEGVFASTWDHLMAYGDLVAQIVGHYDDPVYFELHRPEMAFKTRKWFKERGSATCKKCHVADGILGTQPKTNEIHQPEELNGRTCIECHYNLVHRYVPDEKTFKQEAWNSMIEEEFGLEAGAAEKILHGS